MKHAADLLRRCDLVVRADGRRGRQDVGGNALLLEKGERLGADSEALQHAFDSTTTAAPWSISSAMSAGWMPARDRFRSPAVPFARPPG
jgi:hypothetical protein